MKIILLALVAPVLMGVSKYEMSSPPPAYSYEVATNAEWGQIIDRIIHTESRGDAGAITKGEWAAGLMQITKPARDEFNQWTGSNYNFWDMLDPVKNREVGSYLLTNVFYRYRYGGNVVKAVGAYNAGHTAISRGYWPDDYMAAVIPWHWSRWKEGRRPVCSYGNHVGAKITVYQGPF